MTFLFGLVIANYFVLGNANITVVNIDTDCSNQLSRNKRKGNRSFKMIGLNNEYKSAIILFSLLNVLILIINTIDIWWVWFNFRWDGDYLKKPNKQMMTTLRMPVNTVVFMIIILPRRVPK